MGTAVKDLKPMVGVLLAVTFAVLLVMTFTLGRVSAYQDGLGDALARVRSLEAQIGSAAEAKESSRRAEDRAAGAVAEVQEWWRIDSKNLLAEFQRQLEVDDGNSTRKDTAEP